MKPFLVTLTTLVAAGAMIGGIMLLITPDGSSMQLSSSYLQGTPFSSYVIPGLVLLFLVGGSNLFASIALFQHKRTALTLSLLAGIILLLWMGVQILMIGPLYWLQFFILGAALLITLVSLQLKGKALT